MASGFFIVFEGPEGSGKSTQLRRLAKRLEPLVGDLVVTREPGGTPVGDALRPVLLSPALRIDPLTEFLLYSASRAQLVGEVIAPALQRGAVVLSDRFYGASVAYQGYGRGLALDFIETLTVRVTRGIKPELTLLFDLPPTRGLERAAKRGSKDRLEQADLAFHERVREGFLAQAHSDESWLVLDAERPEDVLAEEVFALVRERIDRARAGAARP
jgi:dTMP kinase